MKKDDYLLKSFIESVLDILEEKAARVDNPPETDEDIVCICDFMKDLFSLKEGDSPNE